MLIVDDHEFIRIYTSNVQQLRVFPDFRGDVGYALMEKWRNGKSVAYYSYKHDPQLLAPVSWAILPNNWKA